MTTGPLGFIGVGNIGGPLAQRLLAHGHELYVTDVNEAALSTMIAAGARAVKSPREIANLCSTVFTCLPSNDICHSVVLGPDGIIHGSAVRTYINLGTTGSALARELSEALKNNHITMLDSPVSGGVEGAKKGTLAVMVSGPQATFAEKEVLLQCLGSRVTFVGEKTGVSQTLKVINSLISTAALFVSSEAMVMGVKAGLDPEIMIRVLNDGTARNSATLDKIPRTVLTRTFDNASAMIISAKDNKIYMEEAEALGVSTWMAHTIRQLFVYMLNQGAAQRDGMAVVEFLEEWAGVQIPKTR